MNTKQRYWSELLEFHVIKGRVQPILKYTRLKEMGMGVDCEEDCLTSKDGRKLLCHVMKVRGEEKHETSEGLYVKVTHSKDAKGSRVTKKNDRLLIPGGVSVVLGPKENRMIIPASKIQGSGIQSIFNVCQLTGIHMSVSLRNSRKLGIQVFNANTQAKIIIQKMCLARILLYPGVEVNGTKVAWRNVPWILMGWR